MASRRDNWRPAVIVLPNQNGVVVPARVKYSRSDSLGNR